MKILFSILLAVSIYQDDGHKNYKVLFTGMTGSGKTVLAVQKMLTEKHDWKIVLDQDEQYHRHLKRLGFDAPIAYTEEQLVRYLAHSGTVLWNPMLKFRGNMVAAFDWTIDWVWNFSGTMTGDKLFLMDDFPDYAPHKDEKYLEHRICEAAGNGRRRSLDIYALCRFYNEGCPKFTGSFNHVFAFKQPDAQCAQLVARQGFDLKRVQNLKEFEYLHLNRDTMVVSPGKTQLPRR